MNRRCIGSRPGGCVGSGRCGAGGTFSVSGSSGSSVMRSPWWEISSGVALGHRVRRLRVADLDLQAALAEREPERQPRERGRQPRREAQPALVVAHPAEPVHDGAPRAGQRRDVQPVLRVVVEVGDVDQRRLGEVVVGQLEVADLGRHHRLRAGRERRVAHGDRLVVGEVARLLVGRERVAAELHRQHEVGLLDDLAAIEVEVGEVAAAAGTGRPSCAGSPRSRCA